MNPSLNLDQMRIGKEDSLYGRRDIMTVFSGKLRAELRNFDLDRAEKLSMELHGVEARGQELSLIEESLWSRLTDRIQDRIQEQKGEVASI